MRSRNISLLSMVATEELQYQQQLKDPVFSPTRPFSNSHHSIRVILICSLSEPVISINFHYEFLSINRVSSSPTSNSNQKNTSNPLPPKSNMKAPKNITPQNSEKSDLNHPDLHALGGISQAVYPKDQPASWDPPIGVGSSEWSCMKGWVCFFGPQNDAGATWGVFGYFFRQFSGVSWWPLSSPDINKASKVPAAWAGHVTKDASCDFKAICNFWKRSIQESPVTRWLKRLAERWAWRGVVVWSWLVFKGVFLVISVCL